MTRKLRVGVIGSGIAGQHLIDLAANPDLFEVPVLCSLDEERGRALAAKHGIETYTTDTNSLFRRDDIDVIDICTPPDSHFELSRKTLESGKHVICEKPLFGSVADVDRMMEIVAGTDRRFMPIFQYRFGMGLQKLKYLVEAGLTGKPFLTTIETHWWRPPAYYAVPWRGKWASELGGCLLGHATHAHDMLNYIHGPVADVFAFGATLVNPIEVEDTASLAVRMRNGSLASLSATLGSREQLSRLRFCFENLVAESSHGAYSMSCEPWRFVAEDEAIQKRIDDALTEIPTMNEGYVRQFELFHQAIMDDTELPVTLRDARNALDLVTAAYQSIRTGRPETLPITKDHPLYHSWLPDTETTKTGA